MKTGILLINTGSPASPEPGDIKAYLTEFLMDERVIDIPAWKRRLLVHGIIAPLRSRKVSRRYASVWTPQGSPLLSITRDLAQKISHAVKLPVEIAMRYGIPSVHNGIKNLSDQKVKKIIVIPMFPHYAMSTFESVVEKFKVEVQKFSGMTYQIIQPYYNNKLFIQALHENSKPYLKNKYEHIIFSYHSLPLRHIHKSDITQNYCLITENCCEIPHVAHEKCYRAQVMETTRLFIKKTGLDVNNTSHTYQSAMKGTEWLGPSTEEKIAGLARSGIKNIAVICPGFVTDNLETVEEIAIRGRESFLAHGGRSLDFIPSLNTHKAWVQAVVNLIRDV